MFFFVQLRIKHKKVLMEFLPPTPESIEPKDQTLTVVWSFFGSYDIKDYSSLAIGYDVQ